MSTKTKTSSTADNYVKTISYRGYEVPIYADEYGQQMYCELDGEEVGFGSFNMGYEDDLKAIIDNKLDTICYFDKFKGAKLEWFENGFSGYRDIKLSYRTRILEIFLVVNKDLVIKNDYQQVKNEAEKILEKYVKEVK